MCIERGAPRLQNAVKEIDVLAENGCRGRTRQQPTAAPDQRTTESDHNPFQQHRQLRSCRNPRAAALGPSTRRRPPTSGPRTTGHGIGPRLFNNMASFARAETHKPQPQAPARDAGPNQRTTGHGPRATGDGHGPRASEQNQQHRQLRSCENHCPARPPLVQ